MPYWNTWLCVVPQNKISSRKYIVRYKTHEFFPSLFQAAQHFIQRHAVQLNHFIKFAHQHQSTSTIKLHLLFNETLHLQNTYQIHKKLLRFENRHISTTEKHWEFQHFIEYFVRWELVSFLFQQIQYSIECYSVIAVYVQLRNWIYCHI